MTDITLDVVSQSPLFNAAPGQPGLIDLIMGIMAMGVMGMMAMMIIPMVSEGTAE